MGNSCSKPSVRENLVELENLCGNSSSEGAEVDSSKKIVVSTMLQPTEEVGKHLGENQSRAEMDIPVDESSNNAVPVAGPSRLMLSRPNIRPENEGQDVDKGMERGQNESERLESDTTTSVDDTSEDPSKMLEIEKKVNKSLNGELAEMKKRLITSHRNNVTLVQQCTSVAYDLKTIVSENNCANVDEILKCAVTLEKLSDVFEEHNDPGHYCLLRNGEVGSPISWKEKISRIQQRQVQAEPSEEDDNVGCCGIRRRRKR